MRKLTLIACILLAFSALPTFAQSPYKLQPGDEVAIWVAQDTQLNREVSIAPDGRLSLPLAGIVEAEGMTIEALEATLVERLQPFYTEHLNLNVMLQPSPSHSSAIIVAGEVTQPGLYPYRSDMTVLHAVSVAGGPYRTALLAADQDRSIILQGDVTNTQKRLNELDITVARLRAEMAGKDTIEIALNLPPAEAKVLIDREQDMLTMRMAEAKARIDDSERLKQIMTQSIDAIQSQIAGMDERIAMAKERQRIATSLIEKGIMQASQRQEIESSIVEMEGVKSQVRTQLAAQEAAILGETTSVNAIVQQRRVALLTELSAAEREQEALNSELRDKSKALATYTALSAPVSTLHYSIQRSHDGKVEEFAADESTLIQPGDLVRVVRTTMPAQTASTSG